jgi:predicted transcriptional regulator
VNDVKNAVLELAQSLPEECTWDEVMYRIFVRQKIDAGLKDAEAGRMVSHEDVFKEFADDDNPMD